MTGNKLYADWLFCKDVKLLIQCLQNANLVVKFVGGAVRDSLLGLHIHDLDMAIASKPQVVKKILQTHGIKILDYGLDHGTITAILTNYNIEITSLRSDIKTYGRRALVDFNSDWQQDSQRRDFTINAIYLSPQGELWDPQSGITDLQQRIVRFIDEPQQRVKEDFLRILRFFRFSAFYGQSVLHKDSLQACADHAHNLQIISIERIKYEMLRLLSSARASAIVQVMQDRKILRHILPEADQSLSGLKFLEEQAKNHKCLSANEGWLRLVSLYASKHWLALGKAWKFSRKEMLRLSHVLTHLNQLPQSISQQKVLVYEYNKQFLSDLILLSGISYDSVRDTIENWHPLAFPLTGADVLGQVPTKEISKIISHARKWWIIETDMKANKKRCFDYAIQIGNTL